MREICLSGCMSSEVLTIGDGQRNRRSCVSRHRAASLTAEWAPSAASKCAELHFLACSREQCPPPSEAMILAPSQERQGTEPVPAQVNSLRNDRHEILRAPRLVRTSQDDKHAVRRRRYRRAAASRVRGRADLQQPRHPPGWGRSPQDAGGDQQQTLLQPSERSFSTHFFATKAA